MTADEAIAEVDKRSAGRTRYDGCPEYLDEVLVEEIRRLRTQHEALIAAKDMVLRAFSGSPLPSHGQCACIDCEGKKAAALLRAAGIMEEKA